MRNTQVLMLLLLGTILVVAGYLLWSSYQILSGPAIARVMKVPTGAQEIVWLAPATSGGTWERIVEAVRQIESNRPSSDTKLKPVRISLDEAFPRQSAAVPEIAIWIEGKEKEPLLLRWYKIGAEMTITEWISALAQRQGSPPLAIIGGTNTRQAEQISEALRENLTAWNGPAPLFLITTATANNLMTLYPGRNFRFSFTNSLMAQGALDFVQAHPQLLWPGRVSAPQFAVSAVGARNPLTQVTLLHAERHYIDFAIMGLAWKDDPYSVDLRNQFTEEFMARFDPTPNETENGVKQSVRGAPSSENKKASVAPQPDSMDPENIFNVENDPFKKGRIKHIDLKEIAYSTGDFFLPNPRDMWAALNDPPPDTPEYDQIRQLIVLPTSASRARRFLKALIDTSPHVVDNLVVVSGDSITFNDIYRDRELSWNIMDLPTPLIIFCHRDPVNKQAGFRKKPSKENPGATTGTQDVLIYWDLLEAVILSVYAKGEMVGDADQMKKHLLQLRWHNHRVTFSKVGSLFFDDQRNRRVGTGEHLVLLKPKLPKKGMSWPESVITVWSREMKSGEMLAWSRSGKNALRANYTNIPYFAAGAPAQGTK